MVLRVPALCCVRAVFYYGVAMLARQPRENPREILWDVRRAKRMNEVSQRARSRSREMPGKGGYVEEANVPRCCQRSSRSFSAGEGVALGRCFESAAGQRHP